MSQKEVENFLRNAILIVDHAKDVLISLLEHYLQNNSSFKTFEQFIRIHQHEIYHLCFNTRLCCQCRPGYCRPKNRVLYPSQLELLFEKNVMLSCHSSRRSNDFCCRAAKLGISVQVLDLTLTACLLKNFCSDLFWNSCLGFKSRTLENFLNDKKHLLYHLWQNSACCHGSCTLASILPTTPSISSQEWNKMFRKTGPCLNTTQLNTATITYCICSISAISGISEASLDPETKITILRHCCSLRKTVDNLVEIRNNYLGHAKQGALSDSEYAELSKTVEHGIMKIAKLSGQESEYQSKIESAKNRCLDVEMAERYKNKLLDIIASQDIQKDIHDKIEKIHGKVATKAAIAKRMPIVIAGKLDDSMRNVTDTVEKGWFENEKMLNRLNSHIDDIPAKLYKFSKHIDHTHKEIDFHLKEKTFVKTKPVKELLKQIGKFDVFIITGSRGSGKSRVGLELLRQIGEKYCSFQLTRITDISDVKEVLNPSMKYVLLLDDVFGQAHYRCSESNVIHVFDIINAYREGGNVIVILTTHNQFIESSPHLFLTHRLFINSFQINLNEKRFACSAVEKRKLLMKYFQNNKIRIVQDKKDENYKDKKTLEPSKHVNLHQETVTNIVRSNPYLGFAQACCIFTMNRIFTRLGLQVFKHPTLYLVNEIDNLRKSGRRHISHKQTYVTLVYILFNEGRLDAINVNIETATNILLSCYNRKDDIITSIEIIAAADEMIGQYVSSDKKSLIYRFSHQAVAESVQISYYNVDPKFVLSLVDLNFILEIVRLQGYCGIIQEVYIIVPCSLYYHLAKRVCQIFLEHYTSKVDHFIHCLCNSYIMRQNDRAFITALMENLCEITVDDTIHLVILDKTRDVPFYFPLAFLLEMIKKENMEEGLKKILEIVQHTVQKNAEDIIVEACRETVLAAFTYLIEFKSSVMKLNLMWNTVQYLKIDFNVNQFFQTAIEHANKLAADWLLKSFPNRVNIVEVLVNIDDVTLNRVPELLPNKSMSQKPTNRVGVMQYLISNSYIFDIKDIMKTACIYNLEDLVQWLLEKHSGQIDISLLVNEACSRGWLKIIDILLNSFELNRQHYNEILTASVRFEWTYTMNSVLSSRTVAQSELETLINECCKFKKFGTLRYIIAYVKWENKPLILHNIVSMDCHIEIMEWSFEELFQMQYYNYRLYEQTELKEWIMELLQLIVPLVDHSQTDMKHVMNKACRHQMGKVIKLLMENVDHTLFDFQSALNKLLEDDVYIDEDLLLLILPHVSHSQTDMKHVMNKACTFLLDRVIKWLLENVDHKLFDFQSALNGLLETKYYDDEDNDNIKEDLILLILPHVSHLQTDMTDVMNKVCRHQMGKVMKWLMENVDHKLFDFQSALKKLLEDDFVIDEDILLLILPNVSHSQTDMKDVMNKACRYQMGKVIKWLMENVDHKLFDFQSAFNELQEDDYDIDEDSLLLILPNVSHSQTDMKDVMNKACRYQMGKVIKWLMENVDHKLFDFQSAFNELQEDDYDIDEDSLLLILPHVSHSKTDMKDVMNKACRYQMGKVIKWLMENVDHKLFDFQSALSKLLEDGGYNGEDSLLRILPNVSHSQTDMKDVMNEACRYQMGKVIKWLMENVDHKLFDFQSAFNELLAASWYKDEDLLQLILPHVSHSQTDMQHVMNKACRYHMNKVIKWLLENVDHKLFDFQSALNELLETIYYDDENIDDIKEDLILLILSHVSHSQTDMKGVLNKACRHSRGKVIKWLMENVDHKLFDFQSALNELLETIYYDDENIDDIKEDLILLILSHVSHSQTDMKGVLNKACRHSRGKVIKWLMENVDHKLFDFQSALNGLLETKYPDDKDNDDTKEDLLLLILPHVSHLQTDMEDIMNIACGYQMGKVIKWLMENVDQELFDFQSALNEFMEGGGYNGEDILLLILPHVNHSQTDMEDIMNKACRYHTGKVIKWLMENVDHKLFDFQSALNELLEIIYYDDEDNDDIKEDLILLILSHVSHSQTDMEDIMNIACGYQMGKVIKWLMENVDHKLFDFQSAFNVVLEVDYNIDEDSLILILSHVNHSQTDMEDVMKKACRYQMGKVIKWLMENVDHKLFDFQSAFNVVLEVDYDIDEDSLILILSHVNHSQTDMEDVMKKACRYQMGKVIKWLMENVDHKLFDFQSAFNELQAASWYKDEDLLQLILPHVSHSQTDMQHVMNKACRYHMNKVIKWLLENVDHKLFDFQSALNELLETIYYDDENIDDIKEDLILLILSHVSHSQTDMKGVLNKACRHSRGKVIKWLMENVDHKLFDFQSALNGLLETKYPDDKDNDDTKEDLLLLILPHVSHLQTDMEDIMNIACGYQMVKVIKWLMENVDHKLFDFQSALNEFMEGGGYNGEEILLLILPHVNHSQTDMMDVMNEACRYQMVKVIKWLMENVDQKLFNQLLENEYDIDEDSLLLILPHVSHLQTDMEDIMNIACRYSRHKVVEWLLEKTEYKVFNVYDALQNAIRTKNGDPTKIVALILTKFDYKSINIKSVMNEACHYGHLQAVKWLLENIHHSEFDMKLVMNEVCFHGGLIELQWMLELLDNTCFDMRSAMVKACRKNKNLDTIKWLWKNINHDVFDMRSAMNNACRYNNTVVVEWLWTNINSDLFDMEDALNNACKQNNIATVKWLLENVDTENFNISKAIMEACANETGGTETVKALLCKIDRSNLDLNTIFVVACNRRATDIVKWLIETTEMNLLDTRLLMNLVLNIDLSEVNTRSKEQTKIQIVSMILDKSNPSEIDMSNVITNACVYGWTDIFKKISTNVDNKHYTISDAIKIACKHGQVEIIRWSLDNINPEFIDIKTVMQESCGFGCLELVKCMWNKTDHNKFDMETSMNDACAFGRREVVEWILENVDCMQLDIKNVILESCKNGWLNTIKKLLLENSVQDILDLTSATSEACIHGKIDIVEWMFTMFGGKSFDLKFLSTVKYSNCEDVTMFLIQTFDNADLKMAVIFSRACKKGWISVAVYALDKIKHNQLNMKEALNNACKNGENKIVQLLLDRVSHDSFDFFTAMVLVSTHGWDEIATLLLEKVDHTRFDFQKAINEACRNDQQDIVELLFKKVDHSSFDIKQTLDIACKSRLNENLIEMILKNTTDSDISMTTLKGISDKPVVVLE